MKIAAIADLHCRANSQGQIRHLLAGVEEADILLLAGDLTDTGLPAEMEVLLDELADLDLPIVAVLGNHDHESEQQEHLAELLTGADILLLDGTVCEIGDVGIVGTKGFCGGFDELFIQPFGERALKRFIQVSLAEAVRLENALVKLDCPHRVALLHYAPIKETVLGEPPELFPFLGSSRLANALDRNPVDVAFHGHAHYGSLQGKTAGGVAVHNVSRFVRERADLPAFCLVEL
jgi:Icc-related predicted phosphoesterase